MNDYKYLALKRHQNWNQKKPFFERYPWVVWVLLLTGFLISGYEFF